MGKPKKHIKIFEFLTIFSTTIGVTIGIGIYLKNDISEGHLLYFTENAYLSIGLWILVGILGISMIIVFIEITSIKTKSGNGTLPSWANVLINRKTGSLISLFYIFFYFPILLGIFSIFSINTIFDILKIQSISKLTQNIISIIISNIILILFYLTNIFLRNISKWIQTIGTFIKFIPLIISLFVGFIFPIKNNVFNNYLELKFNNFFMGILPVLFSFDGFIYAAGLQKEVSNKKIVPKSLFSAMIFITIFYILEVISLFLGTNNGNIFTLFKNVFGISIVKILMWFIILTSLMSINGLTFISPSFGQTIQQENLVYFGNKKLDFKKICLIQMTITICFNLLIMIISLLIMNDPIYLLDLSSNAISFITFLWYINLIIAICINRYTKKIEVKKIKGLYYYSGFSILLLIGSFFYIIYNLFSYNNNYKILYSLLIIIAGIFIIWCINEFLLYKAKNNIKILKK